MKQSEKTHVLIDQVRDLLGQMPSLVCLVEARADIGPKTIKASACAHLYSKSVLGSTHLVEQLLFSMFSSIITFYFELILESFLNF